MAKSLYDKVIAVYDLMSDKVKALAQNLADNYYTAEQTDKAIEAVAAYYITRNAAGDAFTTYADLVNAPVYYSGGVVRVPTRNDYAIVDADETHGGARWRYIYGEEGGDSSDSADSSESVEPTTPWEPQYPISGDETDPLFTAWKNGQRIAAGNKANAYTDGAIALGNSTNATGGGSVAIGSSAKSEAAGAVEIGSGINKTQNSLAFRGFQLAAVTGSSGQEVCKIPNERLSVDSTLSISGAPADAEVTGERIASAENKADQSLIEVGQINALIPKQASAENQLVDTQTMNSSIATNTANFLGTYSYVTDLGFPQPSSAADVDNAAIATALGTLTYQQTPTNNDYVFVSINYTPTTDIDEYRRFKYNGTTGTWAYEYTLNNSSFTAAQWAAINSGITSGDVTKLAGIAAGAQVNVVEIVKVNGTALTPENKAVDITYDDTVTRSSANGVKSSGIWSAIWGALASLPTGFTSLYDWVVDQLAGKQSSLAPGAVTVPGIIKTVYAGVKRQGSTVLLELPTSGVTVNGKALSSDVVLTGADIAVSGTDATKIDAALAGKASTAAATLTQHYTDWVCSPAETQGEYPASYFVAWGTIPSTEIETWCLYTGIPGDADYVDHVDERTPDLPNITSATFVGVDEETVTATRTASGYKLGSQTDKLLASEEEAEALRQGKQDALTFDNAPTSGSNNSVKSGGIWAAIWGALSALPTGFASLYDWVVSKLSEYRHKLDLNVYGYGNATVALPDGFSIKYYGETYTAPVGGETITFIGPVPSSNPNVPNDKFYYPSSLGNLDSFDTNDYSVWCLVCLSGGDTPDMLMYKTGPSYSISGWNSAAPTLTLSNGEATGGAPTMARPIGTTGDTLAKASQLDGKLDKSGGVMTPTFTATAIPPGKVVFGMDAAGPYIGIAYGQNVVMLRPSRIELDGRKVALAAANPTAGNLAALDANGNPTDSGMNRDTNGNLDATEFTFTPEQVADYDSASVGTVINKATTPVVLHNGQHYVARKSFVKTNGGWNVDSVTGRVVLPGASGTGSTALGDATQAMGSGAVSTGKNTKASGAGALSSGQETDAIGTGAHAEGQSTSATATCAHAEGYFTIAQNQSEHAQGEYNASHTGATASERTLNSIGIGDSNKRKNAVEVMRDGKMFVLGLGGYDGTNPTASGVLDLATAVKSDLRYSLVTKTISGGAVTLDDRACNYVNARTLGSSDSLDIDFPALVDGKARDFVLAVECGANPPTISYAAFVTIMAEDASTLTPEEGMNIYSFTEFKTNMFIASRKLVSTVVDNSPENGDQMLLAMQKRGIDTTGITDFGGVETALGLSDTATPQVAIDAIMN